MFSESADYYDQLYSFKDYAQEAAQIDALIQLHNPKAKTILDIACGTAEHMRFLPSTYDLEGLDLDPRLLALAKAKFPNTPFHLGDMSSFNLSKKFDVVLCLFSSIGYLLTTEKLNFCIQCFAKHLNPDGILIVEPWFSKEEWKTNKPHMLTYDKDDLKICRMTYTTTEGNLSVLDFQYLIAEKDKGVRHATEVHRLAMFEEQEFRTAFEAAMVEVEFDPIGLTNRGLYIGKVR
jgi:SAM-dependent methyltransferase